MLCSVKCIPNLGEGRGQGPGVGAGGETRCCCGGRGQADGQVGQVVLCDPVGYVLSLDPRCFGGPALLRPLRLGPALGRGGPLGRRTVGGRRGTVRLRRGPLRDCRPIWTCPDPVTLVPFPDGLVDTRKSPPTMDSSLRGNDGQAKRVSGIRHIQVEVVLVPHGGSAIGATPEWLGPGPLGRIWLRHRGDFVRRSG